jgi:hypothetical protein
MLKMPTKPKVKIEDNGGGHYLISFLSPIKNEDEFNKLIRIHLERGLDEGDTLTNRQWNTRSVTLNTHDIGSFEKKLSFVRIMSGITFNPKP